MARGFLSHGMREAFWSCVSNAEVTLNFMTAKDIKQYQFTGENQPENRRSRKGVPNRSTLLKKWLAIKRRIEADSNPTGKAIKGTVEDEIILALIGKALKGDVAAIREVLDTRYGKAKEHQDVNLSVNQETEDEARLRLARAALAHLQSNIDQMLVDPHMSRNPDADREAVRRDLLAALPQWCAEDWQVELQLLCPEIEQRADNEAAKHDSSGEQI